MISAEQLAMERARVARVARSWMPTPFHHGARLKHVGVDCAQFLAAVFEEAGLVTPDLPEYSVDWFLHEHQERYLDAIAPYTTPIPEGSEIAVGDIALFRFGRSISHAGVIVDIDIERCPVLVHAVRGIGVTMDTLSLTNALQPRLAQIHRLQRWMEAAA